VIHSDRVLGWYPESWLRDALEAFRFSFDRLCGSVGSTCKTAGEAAADLSAASLSRRSFLSRAILSRSAAASELSDKSVLWCSYSGAIKTPMAECCPIHCKLSQTPPERASADPSALSRLDAHQAETQVAGRYQIAVSVRSADDCDSIHPQNRDFTNLLAPPRDLSRATPLAIAVNTHSLSLYEARRSRSENPSYKYTKRIQFAGWN
jgi:hypothetical protein